MASSKKKLTQLELRRLMNEQKKKLQDNAKKIESPLAKYDKDGTLRCIVCETVVRSENVWSIHLNTKTHKQNILAKVKKKEPPKETFAVPFSSSLKRPAAPITSHSSPKKIKGILKNAKPVSVNGPAVYFQENISEENAVSENELSNEKYISKDNNNQNVDVEMSSEHDSLPEGFFDDPKLDAKVRNVEYRDPIEEEWEQFQKEIKEETSKAQQIIAEDQEEATTERQIDEIDEQIRNWSRVLNLEKKKEKVNTTAGGQKSHKNQEEYSDDEDFEEFLDWRSKKSFDHNLNKLTNA